MLFFLTRVGDHERVHELNPFMERFGKTSTHEKEQGAFFDDSRLSVGTSSAGQADRKTVLSKNIFGALS